MTFLSVLYTLIISPLELLFEVIFTIANRIIGNAGLSIIFLSIAVNFFVLPLYKRADELQAEERDIQARMAPDLKHIKRTFKGDERFFMTQEYYRLNNYKPVYALKSSVSLLLQIPFFIAAYNLLSGMQSLQGMQFGFISDLGKEDAMFMIGNFPVNVLPILMTLINVISGVIYTKGHPLKAKIQVYGLAAVFLVLLYRSPSGLVFYWLLNNVFSLLKNIFYKLKDPKKVLSISTAIAGLIILVLTLIRTDLDIRQKFLLSAGCVLLCVPFISRILKNKLKPAAAKANTKNTSVFFTGTVLMALFTGLFIPAAIINDSALEFIDIMGSVRPVVYIFNSLFLALGSWVLWGGVFYFFMNDDIKALFSKGIWCICGVSVLDYMLFGTNLGYLSSTLKYEQTPVFKLSEYLLNLLAVALVAALFLFVYSKFSKITRYILIVGIVTVSAIGGLNTALVAQAYTWYSTRSTATSDMPSIPLSTDGKNVIVLMLDRAMGPEVPYIFNDKPELLEKFDGFTYYPNTVSYGSWTLTGCPALYGGYDYTPERINERDGESLEDKHNEALRVMPVLFGENEFTVTICDPSYAGFEFIPDLSIYDDHPEFNCYNTNGYFNYFDDETNSTAVVNTSARLNEIRNRNFFCYSLMKISPVVLQETIYDKGAYNEAASGASGTLYDVSLAQQTYGISKSTGYYIDFLNAYTVLDRLPEITKINDSTDNTFLMMENDTAHAPCLLQEPDYVPAITVDNTAYDTDMVSRFTVNGRTMNMTTDYQVIHFHANMAAFIKLGEWFDYMRENGVYDNTRIIIVADHGRALGQFDAMCEDTDLEYFTPLFMVKDFYAKGFTVSDEFMTNGDTPAIAASGLIENPENPFTHNPINTDPKSGPQNILFSDAMDTEYATGNTFPAGKWFTYEGNDPLDTNNWTYTGTH